MARPRKVDENKVDTWKSDINQAIPPEIEQKVEEIKVKEEVSPPEFVDTLPPKPLLRVSEVAAYFDVTERTVYLWIEHGHLQTIQTPRGQWRITRESVDGCRFKKKVREEDGNAIE